MRALQSAFDLKARDTQAREVADEVIRRQILRAEQVRLISEIARTSVHDQLVGQTTSLRALAAVGAAAAEGFAGQALPAVGDAQRAVNEDFQLHQGALPNLRDVFDRELAREYHARNPEL